MFTVMKLFEKLGCHNKHDFFKLVLQFLKFGIVGLSNTLISSVVYYVLITAFSESSTVHITAYLIGYVAGTCNAFFWNNRYVFKTEQKRSRVFLKTFVVYGTTALIGLGMQFLTVDVWKLSEYLSFPITLLVTIPLNFVLNKLWAFK